MRLDVYLTPGEVTTADIADRTVIMLDILRASTTIVQALSEGARAIYPVASIDEALRLAKNFGHDEVLLTGERKCVRIEGFDLGNSPIEFTRETVEGKSLVMTTTNGTYALSLTPGASRVLIGSTLNFSAITDELVSSKAEPVFLCAGRERQFALEDAVVAGLMTSRMLELAPGDWVLNDGANAAMALATSFGVSEEVFRMSAGGRSILEAGLPEDLAFCAQVDTLKILPVLHERKIVLSRPNPGA